MRKHLSLPMVLPLVLCVISPAAVTRADEQVDIANWTAAPYWSPPASDTPGEQQEAKGTSSRGRVAEARRALIAGPTALPFIALTPCRLVDTRGNAPLTGGPVHAAMVRSYTLTGVCNVPASAQAISLNATVVKPTVPGFLTLWPQGGAFPPVSTLNFLGNDVIVNAAVVPLSATGGISMALGDANGVVIGDVILDTNGYYAPQTLVSTLNTLSGDVILAQGTNVTITPSGNILTIAATAGGGGVTSIAGSNGISASPATGAVTVTSNATSGNLANAIVSRDAGGSFVAGSVTLAGNLNLPNTTAGFASGAIGFGGLSFLHNFGSNNTFLGRQAGNGTMAGGFNTGVGSLALASNTSGSNLAAFGTNALDSNTTGSFNAAFGSLALHLNSTGSDNSAFGIEALANNSTSGGNSGFGRAALRANTTGAENSAFGRDALFSNSGGSNSAAFGSGALRASTVGGSSAFGFSALRSNTTGLSNAAFGGNALLDNVNGSFNAAFGTGALIHGTGSQNTALGQSAFTALVAGTGNIGIGYFAGESLTSGSNNIYIGADSVGSSESNAIRIGATQTGTFIAGIYSATIGGSGLAVSVDSGGKLGTTSSSRRYKEDIVDIGEESDVLLKLRPVSFFYKPEYDPSRIRQYGLIAEEVAEVAPGLAVFDKEGHPETVRYHLVNAMLLSEVQKQRKMLDAQALELNELHAVVRDLGRRVEMLSRASRR